GFDVEISAQLAQALAYVQEFCEEQASLDDKGAVEHGADLGVAHCFAQQLAQKGETNAILAEHDLAHDLQLVAKSLAGEAQLRSGDRACDQFQFALEYRGQDAFLRMIVAHDMESGDTGHLGELIERDGGELLRGGQLHRAIQDHLLLIGAQTHGSTSWAAAEDRAIFPDLNAKYSAAKSRVSSLPVTTVRATRCAETMTGLMPPPRSVQGATR